PADEKVCAPIFEKYFPRVPSICRRVDTRSFCACVQKKFPARQTPTTCRSSSPPSVACYKNRWAIFFVLPRVSEVPCYPQSIHITPTPPPSRANACVFSPFLPPHCRGITKCLSIVVLTYRSRIDTIAPGVCKKWKKRR